MNEDNNERKLEDLFAKHPDLEKGFVMDPTMHAWFKQYHYGKCTLEEAFIGIIINLKKEKQHYFDQCVKLTETSVASSKIYVNVGKRQLAELEEKGETIMPTAIKPKHFDLTHYKAITGVGRKFVYCPVGNICSWSEGDYDHEWCEWCKKFFSELG